MAGVGTSETPVFSLKLLVDKKKNKVVLAEAGKEIVDVLFSLPTLPMGTIVRFLEKYQQNQKSQAAAIGCFNNLYKSVFDLGTDDFLSEPCKDMLLCPRSVMEKKYRRPKLNIDDTSLKYYGCPIMNKSSCPQRYSYFCSSRCSCGELMTNGLGLYGGVNCAEMFFSNKNLFTITDNMKVGFTSMGLTLKILKDLGYNDADQLQEMLVDVDKNKVLALLQSLFCSDTPLTDVFLTGRVSCTKQSLPLLEGDVGTAESGKQMSISVFTRKIDNKVLYVESGKGFVDLLFTFLALPLYAVRDISTESNIVLGCIGNLVESFKSLSSSQGGFLSTGKCLLPWYYSCRQHLLDVCYEEREEDNYFTQYYIKYQSMDPRSPVCSGFVKEGKTFMVSDGLIITPMNITSNICQLKKWNMKFNDIEEQVINVTGTEATRLLRASFMTSTALNTVFGSILPKKPKQEKL